MPAQGVISNRRGGCLGTEVLTSAGKGVKKRGHRYKLTFSFILVLESQPMEGMLLFTSWWGFIFSSFSQEKSPPQTNPVFLGILNPVKVTEKPKDHKVRSQWTWQ